MSSEMPNIVADHHVVEVMSASLGVLFGVLLTLPKRNSLPKRKTSLFSNHSFLDFVIGQTFWD